MTKSAVVQAMDDIQKALGPTFKERGFKKRGRTYDRLTPDGLTHVVHFQTGPADPPAMTHHTGLTENLHGLITVNLGVYVPEVAEADGMSAGRWVQEYHCTLRQRLAETMGMNDDVWWRASEDPEVVGEVRNGLLNGGFPFLDRYPTRDALLAAVDKDTHHVPGALTRQGSSPRSCSMRRARPTARASGCRSNTTGPWRKGELAMPRPWRK